QHVGAGLDQYVDDPGAGRQIGIAQRYEGPERALAAVLQGGEHRIVTAHAASPSRCRAWAMSLSPRPEMLTISTMSSSASRTSFRPWARAWADSKAQTIPSLRASRAKASSASRSVAPT